MAFLRPVVARRVAGLALLALLTACDNAPTPSVAAVRSASLPEARSARFVKFEEVTEQSGKAFGSMAEFNLIDATGATVDRSKWTATADSAGDNEAPGNAIDGDPKSLWHTKWDGESVASPPPHWFMVGLGVPVRVSGFRYLPRQDKSENGTFAQYRFYVSEDGLNWGEPVAVGNFADTPGATVEKVVVFAKQAANRPPELKAPATQTVAMGQQVALQAVASDADGDLLTFTAEGLPTGVVILSTTGLITGTPIAPGAYRSIVQVTDGKSDPVRVAFDWTVQPAAPLAADAKLAPGEVRFVKLEELTEAHDKPFGSIAEFNVLGADGSNLSRTGWVASADSADISDRPFSAIDGNPATQWHTQWNGAEPPPPHSFIVDMGHGAKVGGFRYLPRQDKSTNGLIARFRFYTSVDGRDWGKPVAEGDLTTIGESRAEKTVRVK